MRPSKMLDLIGKVYDAALDERLWDGVAPAIAQAFKSTSTAVFTIADGSVDFLSRTANQEEVLIREYQEHYHRLDVWAQGGAHAGQGAVVLGHEIIAPSVFEETEFYRDWARRIEVFDLVGSVFGIAPRETGIIGVHRPRNASAYDPRDKMAAAAFVPHLQRALQIRRRLAEAQIDRDAALDALDRSGTAIVVATRDGRVVYANRRAEALLRVGDGLKTMGGRLAVSRRATGQRLSALIRDAADTAAGQGASRGNTLAIERGERLPLTLLVAPFRPARDGFGAGFPAAILFIRDPEAPTATGLLLQGLFGLTPAEAGIAAALANGRSVDEIAAAHRIALNTARVHVRNILAKTSTTRQAQFVALALSSIAGVTGG